MLSLRGWEEYGGERPCGIAFLFLVGTAGVGVSVIHRRDAIHGVRLTFQFGTTMEKN